MWADVPLPSARSAQRADLLPVYALGTAPRPGALYRDGIDVDLHWHFHEMHKLVSAELHGRTPLAVLPPIDA